MGTLMERKIKINTVQYTSRVIWSWVSEVSGVSDIFDDGRARDEF